MAAVTRRDLARALKEEYGGTIAGNDVWIQAFVDVLARKISENGRVEIRGFGAFNLNSVKAHTTVNPSHPIEDGGERQTMKVPKTYTVDFRPSKTYKEQLRKDHAPKKSKTAGSKKKRARE